jgi:DNA repair exonuclease SbcCD nuclease subunit
MIRFLHVADLHLGMRITRFDDRARGRMAEARFHSLQQVRGIAERKRVDFIVVAGDLFDDANVSRADAVRAFEILESREGACPAYVIPGNHDPHIPGGVWDRDPWFREQPQLRVHVLRSSEPIPIPNLPVTLFPGPLRQKRSLDDPTAWIAAHPREDGEARIRIGVAHGSLNVGMRLPIDDHLIRPDAAAALDLDYLALGHWHKKFLHASPDGTVRTAYCGTHEPMGFPGGGVATGWTSYSSDADDERFRDDGVGRALLVSIAEPGAPPLVEPIDVGRLRWSAMQRHVAAQSIGSLVSEFSRWENPELTVLRLSLGGAADPQSLQRFEELQQIVENRFHPGSSLDMGGVYIEPRADQLAEVVGDGVLRRVLERLQGDSQSSDPSVKRTADHALKLLYRMAWEAQPA